MLLLLLHEKIKKKKKNHGHTLPGQQHAQLGYGMRKNGEIQSLLPEGKLDG